MTCYDEHLATGQQVRCLTIACGTEATGRSPSSARWIVQFCGRVAITSKSSCNEHLAIGQQRRRVTSAGGPEAAGGIPGSARRIIYLRARDSIENTVVVSSRDEHLAVGQRRRRVTIAKGVEAAGHGLGNLHAASAGTIGL